MKIIVRYYNDWGNMSTKVVQVHQDQLISDLKKQIKQLTDIDENDQILMLDQVALEDQNQLSQYSIEDGAFIYVNLKIDVTSSDAIDQNDSDLSQEILIQTQFTQQKLLQKLGIIQEDDENEENEENKSKKSGAIRTQAELVQEFIKYINNNDWNSAKILLQDSQEQTTKNSSNFPSMEDSAFDIINDRSFTGWNSLHYACHLGYEEIVKELIIHGADVNLSTKDNYSPLILAIQKCRIDCAKVLLQMNSCDVNFEGNQGKTALYVAVLKGELDIVDLILKHVRFDRNSVNIQELRGDQQAIDLVVNFCNQQKNQEKVKPKAIKGYCKKVNIMKFFHYKRYFVLDPDSGTLTRYKEEKDYPINPIEIIALSNIKSVGYPQKPWYFKSDHFYLSILYKKSSSFEILLICSKSQKTIHSWKKSLEESIEYYHDQEIEFNKLSNEAGFDELVRTMQDTIISQNDFNIIADSRCGTMQQEQLERLQDLENDIQTKKQQQQTKSDEYTIKAPITKAKLEPKKVKERPSIKLTSENQISKIQHLNNYHVVKQIGQGAFGKVYMVQFKPTQQIFAMKQLNKRKLIQKKQVKFAVTECNVLKQVQCPYVVNLFQSFQTPSNLYLVMDYCGGGDLSFHLSKKRRFQEAVCKNIMRQTMKAIEYLHSQNIIYRDLKPENIIIDNNKRIKLVDFGLSKQTEIGIAKTFCGSPAYLPPEVLNNEGSVQASDIYGLGTVLYEMLTGDPPYFNDDIDILFENIKNENLKLPQFVSKPCQQLLIGLLQKDPSKRLGCRKPSEVNWNQIKKNEWLEWDNPDEDFPYVDKLDDLQVMAKTNSHNIGDKDYDDENKNVNRIAHWTFTREYKQQ